MSVAGAGKGDKRPIIIVRKKVTHGAHHGGSWKVAYADFVTAMMAFFLVMWIMGMDAKTKDLIQGYFNNPIGFKKAASAGTNPLSSGNSPRNMDIRRIALVTRDYQRTRFQQIREGIRADLAAEDSLRSLAGQVEIIITEQALRIELLEGADGASFFDLGSANLKPRARRVLQLIARELRRIPNDLVLEGHTDAAAYGSGPYDNWALSTDRANAARRALVEGGVDPARISEVRGYADRDLRLPSSPLDPANRRVSILLPFVEPKSIRQFVPGENVLKPVASASGAGEGGSDGSP